MESGDLQRNWPADRVERWPLERLVPYARNARTHSETQIDQIAASMREWGWTNPILVDEVGTIIAGHGRVAAARRLGLTEAPVMVATGWTDAQKRAYVLADNKLALNAGWDNELLRSELDGLREAGADLGLIGFSDDDLLELFGVAKTGDADPDAVPELQETPISVVGDVWVMGPHRLAVGDSCDVTVYDRLLESKGGAGRRRLDRSAVQRGLRGPRGLDQERRHVRLGLSRLSAIGVQRDDHGA